MTLKNLWSQRRDFVDRKDKTLEVVAFLDYDFYIKRKKQYPYATMWGTNMQSNNRHTNDARFVIKTLKAYVCFYLFRKSIMLGFFLTFVRTTAKMHNEKGSGIFFPIILESVFTLKDQ